MESPGAGIKSFREGVLEVVKQNYDLKKLPVLNPMHDQYVNDIEIKDGQFIMHYDHISNYCNDKFHSCDVIFSGIEDSDVYAEIRKERGMKSRSNGYYDKDFVKYIKKRQYIIETINFYIGYREVIIYAALVKKGKFSDDCIIRVTANEVSYEWL